jgi:hypothetical protein
MLSDVARPRDQVMTVAFLAMQPRAFSAADRPVARRITDYVALAVSGEQLHGGVALVVARRLPRADS